MSVLVTGGAGFIGSVVAEYLAGAGEDVIVLDDLSKGYRGALMPEAVFVEGSILDKARLADLFRDHEVDTVLHFAASIEVGESCENPLKYFENNTIGAHCVLGAMVSAGVRRFILSSTAAVYGNPESVPLEETAPTRPVNPYGLSKRMIEEMLEWHDGAYGLRYVALRYFNASGASALHGEAHVPETHLIPNILMAAEGKRDRVDLFGDDYPTRDGTCIRDYVHVEDLAQAHVKAMEYLRAGGRSEAVNVGNSVGVSVLEVIDAVQRITGKDVPVHRAPRRAGDADILVASCDKARRVLGWEPKKSNIDAMVRDAWNWRCSHPHGYV